MAYNYRQINLIGQPNSTLYKNRKDNKKQYNESIKIENLQNDNTPSVNSLSTLDLPPISRNNKASLVMKITTTNSAQKLMEKQETVIDDFDMLVDKDSENINQQSDQKQEVKKEKRPPIPRKKDEFTLNFANNQQTPETSMPNSRQNKNRSSSSSKQVAMKEEVTYTFTGKSSEPQVQVKIRKSQSQSKYQPSGIKQPDLSPGKNDSKKQVFNKLFDLIKENPNTLIKQLILNEVNEGEPFVDNNKFQIILKTLYEDFFNEEEFLIIFEEFCVLNLQGLVNYRYFLGKADKKLYEDDNQKVYYEHARLLAADAFTKIVKVIKQEKIDNRKAFKSFDFDKKGYISPQSLKQALLVMNFEFTDIEIDAIFYYCDKNKDNQISFSEFKNALTEFQQPQQQSQPNIQKTSLEICQQIFKRIREVLKNENISPMLAFQSIDMDNDNKLSLKDLHQSFIMMNLHYTQEDVKNILKHYDFDKDGFLNYDEFVVALNN